MRTNKSLPVVINLVSAIIGIGILYLASLFWMGTKEDYENLVNNSYWPFFANRMLFNSLIGLMIITIIGMINLLIQKIKKTKIEILKILIIDFVGFTFFSIVFIITQLYSASTSL